MTDTQKGHCRFEFLCDKQWDGRERLDQSIEYLGRANGLFRMVDLC